MATNRYDDWRPIRLYGEGVQPRTGRHWNCLPAWDITAVYDKPDAEIPHPDYVRMLRDPVKAYRNQDRRKSVFWDRHVDRRFHIEYPRAAKDAPRAQGALGDPDREWAILIEARDRYLRDAGLTPQSDPLKIAKCLADSFGANSYFKDKPLCPAFTPANARNLCNGLEGVLYQSNCVGCSKAFAILADSLGLATRNLGCDGHWVAEVKIGDHWHMVDSVGRHASHAGTDLFYRANYMECTLDPMGGHADKMEQMRDGFWRRMNPQFHFHAGQWSSPLTLRYAAGNAYALYPEASRWAVYSYDGKRLPILAAAGGFYWPVIHDERDAEDMKRLRLAAFPQPLSMQPGNRDYLYHPFRAGERLRQSFWLGALDGLKAIELELTFAPSAVSDFSENTGRQLVLKIGAFERSLADLQAWPPRTVDGSPIAAPADANALRSSVALPAEVFRAESVNWIELHQRSGTLLYAPCVPAVMEPYIAPLWTETDDTWNPPVPVRRPQP